MRIFERMSSEWPAAQGINAPASAPVVLDNWLGIEKCVGRAKMAVIPERGSPV